VIGVLPMARRLYASGIVDRQRYLFSPVGAGRVVSELELSMANKCTLAMHAMTSLQACQRRVRVRGKVIGASATSIMISQDHDMLPPKCNGLCICQTISGSACGA